VTTLCRERNHELDWIENRLLTDNFNREEVDVRHWSEIGTYTNVLFRIRRIAAKPSRWGTGPDADRVMTPNLTGIGMELRKRAPDHECRQPECDRGLKQHERHTSQPNSGARSLRLFLRF
jgi:hypothetical protein